MGAHEAASFDDDYLLPPPPEDYDDPGYSDYRSSGSGGSSGSNFSPGGYHEMPHDDQAERGILGVMIGRPDIVLQMEQGLIAEDFYKPAHQIIYGAILDRLSNNKDVDPVLIVDQLERSGKLDRVGGPGYIHTLVQSAPIAAFTEQYASIIIEKAILRRLVEAGTRVVQLGYEGNDDAAEVDAVVDHAQQEIFAVGRRKATEDYQSLRDVIKPTLDELDQIATHGGLATGVPTGFTELDELTNGLHGGQMIIVAARPGVGKSTLALDFMRNASVKHGMTSVIFSLEMSKNEIAMRLLSAETDIKLATMRAGKMNDQQWSKLAQRSGELSEAPLYIDDSPNLTMMDIRAKSRKLKEHHDLKLIVVDYLQLMSSGKKVESRQQEVAEFSRQLKLLAKELDVPLVAISQLNRGPESRTDKKPQIADLRESGSLEQDADIVMLLYRPDSQDPESERAGEADIIVAKHRGGPIDTIPVNARLHISRFENLAAGLG